MVCQAMKALKRGKAVRGIRACLALASLTVPHTGPRLQSCNPIDPCVFARTLLVPLGVHKHQSAHRPPRVAPSLPPQPLCPLTHHSPSPTASSQPPPTSPHPQHCPSAPSPCAQVSLAHPESCQQLLIVLRHPMGRTFAEKIRLKAMDEHTHAVA